MTDHSPETYFASFGTIESVKRTRFQKVVAKTMVTNATTIPHVTHCDDLDVTCWSNGARRRASRLRR